VTELDPAAAPSPPPLYVRGRRRPGPSSWGYDPDAPVLIPARRVEFAKPPPEYIGQAIEFLSSEGTFKNRRRELLDLRKRSRRVDGRTVIFTPGLRADEPESRMGELRKPRGDHRARHHAALMALVEHAGPTRSNPRLDAVGIWSSYIDAKGEKQPRLERFLTRHEIAARIGVPVKEADVLIREWKNAGYIERRQRRRKKFDRHGKLLAYEGERASLLLTEKFYRSCGPSVWRARAKHLGLFKRPPAEPEGPTAPGSDARPPPFTPPQARGWGPPDDDPPDPTS
jgi:hypothetical protein